MLYRHDGESWNRRPLLDAARSAHPNCLLTHDSSISIDADDHVYVALQTAPPGGRWGGEGSQVVLLHSGDGCETFDAIMISDRDDQPNWQPSLERPTSYHQGRPDVPTLLYTHGPRGENLVSSEVTETHFVELVKS